MPASRTTPPMTRTHHLFGGGGEGGRGPREGGREGRREEGGRGGGKREGGRGGGKREGGGKEGGEEGRGREGGKREGGREERGREGGKKKEGVVNTCHIAQPTHCNKECFSFPTHPRKLK